MQPFARGTCEWRNKPLERVLCRPAAPQIGGGAPSPAVGYGGQRAVGVRGCVPMAAGSLLPACPIGPTTSCV